MDCVDYKPSSKARRGCDSLEQGWVVLAPPSHLLVWSIEHLVDTGEVGS
jgi:hypothetical protein